GVELERRDGGRAVAEVDGQGAGVRVVRRNAAGRRSARWCTARRRRRPGRAGRALRGGGTPRGRGTRRGRRPLRARRRAQRAGLGGRYPAVDAAEAIGGGRAAGHLAPRLRYWGHRIIFPYPPLCVVRLPAPPPAVLRLFSGFAARSPARPIRAGRLPARTPALRRA